MKSFNKSPAFTLIELMLVLSIVLILIVIAVPVIGNIIQNQETKHFFIQFESDILYAQNYAIKNEGYVTVRLKGDSYFIEDDNSILRTRQYPKHIRRSYTQYFRFKKTGSVTGINTYYFNVNDEKYKVKFLLGKGRQRIEKE